MVYLQGVDYYAYVNIKETTEYEVILVFNNTVTVKKSNMTF